MTAVKLDFKDALKIDMERLGMSEASLGKALGISQQAVHKWIERGFPPLSRLDALLAVLGPDSEVGRLGRERLYHSGSRTIVFKPPVTRPASPAMYSRLHAQTLRAMHEAAESELWAALPPALRVNVERPVLLGDHTMRFDYVSDRLLAEVVFVDDRTSSRNTAATVLALITAAQAARNASRSEGKEHAPHTLLLIIQPDGGEPVRMSTLVTAAIEQFRIETLHVLSGADAARAIALREGVKVEPPTIEEPDE